MNVSVAQHKVIKTKATTQVHTGDGILHGVCINDIGSACTIAIYDDTGSGTTKEIATINPTVTGFIPFGVRVTEGIAVVTAGSTAGNYTFIYE